MKNRKNGSSGFFSLGNLVLLALVVGGVYYASKHDIAAKFNAYVENLRSNGTSSGVLSGLGNFSFDSSSLTSLFGSLADPILSGSSPKQIRQPIEGTAVSLPGPLEKIKTAPTYGNTSTPFETVAGPLSIAGIIQNTNTERTKRGITALTENAALDASAKVKAEDILARQYFEHTAPDGKTISDLVKAAGYVYVRVGENLALGNFKDDADVVTAWMNSTGHRANILDARYTEMGVGVATGTYEGATVVVAVQHFGKPRSDCPEISDVLRAQVEGGKAELDILGKTLEQLKKDIEEGRAKGEDMNAQVEIYNAGVEKYQTRSKEVEALRLQYNAQVDAFNSCVTK